MDFIKTGCPLGEVVMATQTKSDARLNFRLSSDLKETIAEAAATLGLSVSSFAISTLARTARTVLQERNVTRLTTRDRDAFLAILDADTKPNKALVQAAKRYKKHFG
jgi:uncharacterized protein (DUF1778 family)